MRRHTLLALVALLTLMIHSTIPSRANVASPTPPTAFAGAFVLNEILIGLKTDVAIQAVRSDVGVMSTLGISSLDILNRQFNVQAIEPLFDQVSLADTTASQYGLDRIYKLEVPAGTDIFTMIAAYANDPAIAYAEPNRIYQATTLPDEPNLAKQWGLNNTGQTKGLADADIDAPEAWAITQGSAKVLIAIVDTGVDYKHPDLAGERVRTDIDRDFANNDNDAMDDHGHGTFVAGVAAATTNNGIGIAGVCPNCTILPIKVLDKDGKGSTEQVAQGIQYAAEAGAKIISMSLGFQAKCGCSQTVARTINYAYDNGSILIAASGNDSDKQQISYPASSPRVMAVGASDHNDQEADFSNRDSYLDIVAPGKDIYSLKLNGEYDTASGTSAATPFVSGVAGLIMSVNPQLSNAQIWWRLYQSSDDFPAKSQTADTTAQALGAANIPNPATLTHHFFIPNIIRDRTTSGRLNAEKSLKYAGNGTMFAPVDTCSNEPNCSPGCGAEVSLAGSASGATTLEVLRRFRDQQLLTSNAGATWVTLYEKHRLEFATALARNAPLRSQARDALGLWLPLINAQLDAQSTEPVLLEARHVQAVRSMINSLQAQGSFAFQHDLNAAAASVDLAESYIGRDVREFWQAVGLPKK
jgi:thermitase